MTSRMEGAEPDRKIVISCDGPSCGQQLDNNQIAEAGGLFAMGWKAKFNDESRKLMHFCPAHVEMVNG